MLSDVEREIIANCVKSLKGRATTSPEITAALQGECRLFLETYVIYPLETIINPNRTREDMKTARKLSLD